MRKRDRQLLKDIEWAMRCDLVAAGEDDIRADPGLQKKERHADRLHRLIERLENGRPR